MKTIAIINQKGGVAKSTTAHAIGTGLARKGLRVLLIDLDPQGNLTYVTGAKEDGGAWDVLNGKRVQDAVQKAGDLEILASTPDLSTPDLKIKGERKLYKLRDALHRVQYDAVIIDTPPSLGVLTLNAATAADAVIIPAQADVLSVEGVKQLGTTLAWIRATTNPDLNVCGVLICRYRAQTRAAGIYTKSLKVLAEALGGSLIQTRIRECVKIQEAAAFKRSIYDHAPRSNGAADYAAATEEIYERIWRA